MNHIASQHKQLLNSAPQSSRLPLDGSLQSGQMLNKEKSTPPRTEGSSALPSPGLHSGASSLPRFSGNRHASDNRSTDTSLIPIRETNSQASKGQANPALPLDLSCMQEPCQKPSRRKGVARKLAVEQIDDEDVTEYFSNFLPTPGQEFGNKGIIAGAAQRISHSREHSEMSSSPKTESGLKESIQESRNEEQMYSLHQASRSSMQKPLSKTEDRANQISTINCNEQPVLAPPCLGVEQEGNQRKDSQTVTANRVATASTASPPKTYKCHHCGIIFLDYILYSMHTGYHNFDDPLRCNICGRRSNDIHEFYTHIGKFAHPES